MQAWFVCTRLLFPCPHSTVALLNIRNTHGRYMFDNHADTFCGHYNATQLLIYTGQWLLSRTWGARIVTQHFRDELTSSIPILFIGCFVKSGVWTELLLNRLILLISVTFRLEWNPHLVFFWWGEEDNLMTWMRKWSVIVISSSVNRVSIFKIQWLLYVPPALTYHKLCVLSVYVCVFRMVLTINSDCFPKYH
jgi:hypothetical protein